MHEASVVTDLVRLAEHVVTIEGAVRATDVIVAQGRLGHISPQHLREHFRIAAVGTVVEGARLEVRTEGEDERLRLVSVTVEDA